MVEQDLAQREVLKQAASRAVTINSKGMVSVDGTILEGLDGQRAIEVFLEGVMEDVKELGLAGATKLYRGFSRVPGRLGKALASSLRLSRMLDADRVGVPGDNLSCKDTFFHLWTR